MDWQRAFVLAVGQFDAKAINHISRTVAFSGLLQAKVIITAGAVCTSLSLTIDPFVIWAPGAHRHTFSLLY